MSRAKLLSLVAILAFLGMPLLAPFTSAAPVDLSAPNGAVVFTFDAGYKADLNVAARLEAHGFHGTFYIITGALGMGGVMTRQDVANVSARGHDVESETVTHTDLTTVSSAQLASELADSQSTLQSITGKPVMHLAYPYGSHNPTVDAATASRYQSGRSVTTNPNDFLGTVDAYGLPGLMVLKATSVATAESYVDFAVSNHVTVVLSFENVVTNPGTWDWTPAQLELLLTYTQGKGVPVKTVADVFGAAAPTPPGAPSLSATPGNAFVKLAWTTPFNGNSPITGYRLYRGTSSGAETLYRSLGATNAFNDTNVTNGQSYFYQVSAVNGVGEGPRSSEVTARPSVTQPPPFLPGTVVFTLDDGQQNQIAAAQTLVNHGFRGTFYIVSDCPNSEVGVDCMSNSQVVALSQAGHDIESHTVTHPDLTTLSATQLTNELSSSKTTLQTLVGKPITSLAYPYGAHNANVETQTAKYYKDARIYLTNPDPNNLGMLLAQSGTNPYVIAGVGVAAATSLARAEAYVDYAVAHNVTIVLVFHNIVSGGDTYDWTPSNFNALADYVAAKHVPVKTMAQVYG
ncbi:MAG: hypothetical protein QOE90_2713 [Thermoplasmata archaeon]|jgi:peptidoglycan/xylan/chitin deacetylase (PgdA/CDA1 family)|nr:hypothetical protein [Thermoplasmata archaeon]